MLGVSPQQRRHRNEQFQGPIWRLARRRALFPEITLCTGARLRLYIRHARRCAAALHLWKMSAGSSRADGHALSFQLRQALDVCG
jgi:hypothetical protein